MNGQGGRPIEILLVEDNLGDVRLIQEALRDGKVWNNPHVISDGERGTRLHLSTRKIRRCASA